MKLFIFCGLLLFLSVSASPETGNSTLKNAASKPVPLQACSQPSDCSIVCPILLKSKSQTVGVASCRCGGKLKYSKLCYKHKLLAKSMQRCRKCTDDSQCSTTCLPPEKGGVCRDCVSEVTLMARETCFPTCGQEQEGEECIAPGLTPYSSGSRCVATAWLENNGHSKGIFKKLGNERVVCIPGFPCGTPGHMIRVCNSAQACQLKTYAELCAARMDCLESVVPVSQLKHSYDWSLVSSSTCDSSATLYLTSVSKNPGSSEYSLSSVIALIGDKLNRHGLGSITDVLISLPYTFRAGVYQRKMRMAAVFSV